MLKLHALYSRKHDTDRTDSLISCLVGYRDIPREECLYNILQINLSHTYLLGEQFVYPFKESKKEKKK